MDGMVPVTYGEAEDGAPNLEGTALGEGTELLCVDFLLCSSSCALVGW
jgi:hypothetical protein